MKYAPIDSVSVSSFTVRQVSSAGVRVYQRVFKRIIDTMLVAVSLPIVVPVIAVLALIIRRDGGPAFFVQPRVGLHGHVFPCFKLRTMHVDAETRLAEMCAADPIIAAEWHRDQKLRIDPRITKFGCFLRRSSLDELPQLFNVLRGEMSVVGPRPFLPSQEDLYRQAGGRAYYAMRPGITGSWQVAGRGDTRFVDRVGFDDDYHSRLSLKEDLLILLKTVSVVIKSTGR
ncbi:sugar transferase [Marivivens sp. JLT3646]|uniref:sugar transferase n=1 Tax=Marivivens sp. JLT3646 TaxID=1920883 RepID=UPI0009EF1B77|nr:sugar transferase [Marivivens sp. JLT3646]